MGLLEDIEKPEDIKSLSIDELKELTSEIREVIIDTVSKNGGHLAPSLGVVELTLALLYVFSPPNDRIIWDVGHQSYAYKILTGRRKIFHTLRKHGGLSGFLNRFESPFDPVITGHSGTSISIGLGIKEGMLKKGENGKVIVIIGDGSLGSGLALEGLNNAGVLDRDLLIILNDNEMSISKNVGAMSAYLNRIMTGKWVSRTREEIKKFIGTLPDPLKKTIGRMAKYMEETIKGIFTPGIIFEELGIKYFGPLDGHDLSNLIPTLKNISSWKGPVLLHVLTKKGKGYPPAEKDPESFHGTGPFVKETGELIKKKAPPTYTEVFGKYLVEFAKEDEKIVAITAAMKKGTGLDLFSREFPDRFYDTGIAEQHAVTFAAGLSREGLKPVVAIYSTFLQRAFDQIIHDVCLQDFHVIFAVDRGGLVGEDGPTHHGAFDLSYLRIIPNMVVMAPKDEKELVDMLYTSLEYGKPISFRYPRSSGVGVEIGEPEIIPIGKGELLLEGGDLLIIAIGSMVYPALKAAKNFNNVSLINARFIKPIDEELIKSMAKKIGKILVVEDNTKIGGLGSSILEVLAGEVPIRGFSHIALPDKFVEHGDLKTLRKKYLLDEDGIAREIDKLLSRGRFTIV